MILQFLLIFPILWVLMSAFGPPTAWEKAEAGLTERIVFRCALGLGVLSYMILGLGLIGLLSRASLGILFAAIFVVSLPGQKAFAREIARRSRKLEGDGSPKSKGDGSPKTDSDRSPKAASMSAEGVLRTLIVALLALIAALTALGAAAPPNSIDWDGLSYHLADPKIYLQAGRIAYLPWEHHSNFPFSTEMLFAFGLAFGSVALAKAFHWAMGMLTAAAISAAYARFSREGDRPTSMPLLPAALFLGAPLVFWEGTVAYIDLGATLFAFLSVVALLVATGDRDGFSRESRMRWLALSGAMMGFGIGCKTTDGILLPFLLLWLIYRIARHREEVGWRSALAFVAPSVVIAAPWFVKSAIWTGNPVYPFFYGLFGGANWSAELARLYSVEQSQFGMGRSAAALLMLPWNLTFHAEVFSKGIGQFASPGPYFLALLPTLVLARPLPRWCVACLSLTLGYVIVWVGLTQQIRYLLPLLPLLALVAAHGCESERIGAAGRLGACGFCAAMLLLTAGRGFLYAQPMIPVALGMQAPEDYLASTYQLEPATRFVNESLPKGAKLLLLEETRGFYFDRAYVWGNPGHHTLIPWESFQTPEIMASWLRAHGFTHVLLNFLWMRKGWGSAPWERTVRNGVREGILTPVFEERKVAIYRIAGA